MYLTKSFHCYDNAEMNDWMNAAVTKGYKLAKVEACGSSTILIIMEKV